MATLEYLWHVWRRGLSARSLVPAHRPAAAESREVFARLGGRGKERRRKRAAEIAEVWRTPYLHTACLLATSYNIRSYADVLVDLIGTHIWIHYKNGKYSFHAFAYNIFLLPG